MKTQTHLSPEAPTDWCDYPKQPDRVGNFVEDLEIIQRLIGSTAYDWRKRNGKFQIRCSS